ncbi:MAG: hypothetical protein ACYCTE_12455 [Acidimicrobiales bacterium]
MATAYTVEPVLRSAAEAMSSHDDGPTQGSRTANQQGHMATALVALNRPR